MNRLVEALGVFAGHSYARVEHITGSTTALLTLGLVAAGLLLWHRQRRARATSQ